MRTHIDLDEGLIHQVMSLGHFPTKKAAIHTALKEYTKHLKRQQLLALRGNVPWVGDLDELRANRQSEVNDAR